MLWGEDNKRVTGTYHMKKKNPVTSHGYFPRNPTFVSLPKKRVRPLESNESTPSEPETDLIAYPAESPPSAEAALTGLRISLFSGKLSRRSNGRSWRPEIKFPPSPIDPIGLAKAVNDDDAVLNWRLIALIGRLSCGTPVTVSVARSSTRDSISRLVQWFFDDELWQWEGRKRSMRLSRISRRDTSWSRVSRSIVLQWKWLCDMIQRWRVMILDKNLEILV